MPGSSVSIADYLAIDIACRHTSIQRSVIADYFGITVNALNARLRTCSDRLKTFPDFIAYGTNILNAVTILRPEFAGKMHPIWELSRRLLQSHTDGMLAAELAGFEENQGIMYSFMANSNFNKDSDRLPLTRPDADMLELPSGRKRKHDGVFSSPSRVPSPALTVPLPDIKPVDIQGSVPNKQIPDVKESDLVKNDEAEKAQARGTKAEPYSQFELCFIYIARRVRMIDWDIISWALNRYKTPTISMLAEARAAFDEYHDLIIETLRSCCWPEDSMYLISLAASECLDAIDRGTWAEELKQFKNNRGHLYQIYTQRKIERLFRKTIETSAEKKARRRKERKFGYEWQSYNDFQRIPLRKRVGAIITADTIKPRKRRTREEIAAAKIERLQLKAKIKADTLRANEELKARAKAAKEHEKAERERLKAEKAAEKISPQPAEKKRKKTKKIIDEVSKEYPLTQSERDFSNRLKSGTDITNWSYAAPQWTLPSTMEESRSRFSIANLITPQEAPPRHSLSLSSLLN